ncbi:MAG: hypothetical protein ACR2MW_04625 [Chthoniobacterales bacterium]
MDQSADPHCRDNRPSDPCEPIDKLLLLGNAGATQISEKGGGTRAALTFGPRLVSYLKVNGKDYPLKLDPRSSLLDLSRENLQLTGSKKGLRSRAMRLPKVTNTTPLRSNWQSAPSRARSARLPGWRDDEGARLLGADVLPHVPIISRLMESWRGAGSVKWGRAEACPSEDERGRFSIRDRPPR